MAQIYFESWSDKRVRWATSGIGQTVLCLLQSETGGQMLWGMGKDGKDPGTPWPSMSGPPYPLRPSPSERLSPPSPYYSDLELHQAGFQGITIGLRPAPWEIRPNEPNLEI